MSIVVSGADTRLTLETPEAYTLDVVTQDQVTKVNVSSLSVFGARHGLETLSQLIAFDEDEGAFRVSVGGGGIILDPILLAYKSLEAWGMHDKRVRCKVLWLKRMPEKESADILSICRLHRP